MSRLMAAVVVMGNIVLNKSEDSDWYLIERAEHDGRDWIQTETDDGGQTSGTCMVSARISDACIEGTSEHMIGIAHAIEKGGEYNAKRCAAKTVGGRVLFHSPRHSQVRASVSMTAAMRLAVSIRQATGTEPGT